MTKKQKTDKYITAAVLPIGTPSVTGDIYPRKVLEKAVNDFNAKTLSPVTLGLPNDGKIHLDNLAGEAKLFMGEKDVVAEIELHDTPAGMKAKKLINGVQPISIGFGSTDEDHVVQNDFLFRSISICSKKSMGEKEYLKSDSCIDQASRENIHALDTPPNETGKTSVEQECIDEIGQLALSSLGCCPEKIPVKGYDPKAVLSCVRGMKRRLEALTYQHSSEILTCDCEDPCQITTPNPSVAWCRICGRPIKITPTEKKGS